MSDRLLGFHGGEQAPYRTRGKADRVVIGYFHVLPRSNTQGAHPDEGKRVHHSKSKSLYPIDFMMIIAAVAHAIQQRGNSFTPTGDNSHESLETLS